MVSTLNAGPAVFSSGDTSSEELLSSGMPEWTSSSEPTAGENVNTAGGFTARFNCQVIAYVIM